MYKLVSSNSSNLTSVSAAETNGTTVLDWSFDITGASVSALTSSTTYYFAVIVRDEAGNKALYTSASATTLDTTAPVPGSGITFSGVGANSIGVSWGAASDELSPPSTLQYKLVRATSAAAIDSVTEADAIAGAGLVLNWTAATTGATATSLASSTVYYFTVLVKDAAGNKSAYPVVSQATLDITAPVPGSLITFSLTTSSGTTATWGAATDEFTAQSGLSYKLVYAASSSAIDSIAEANAITGAGLAMNWSTNTLTSAVTGLSGSTTYYFAVLVRDASGNMALYDILSVTTADGTAPVAGSGIVFSSTSTSGTTVTWGAATDNITLPANLQYKLVYSLSSNLGSVTDAEANGTVSMNWTANTITHAVTGLAASTAYFFAVLVMDEAGNKALYTQQSVTTNANTGTASGTITNTATGAVLSGVTLNFRLGTGVYSGDIVLTETTSGDGTYNATLPEGTYTCEMAKTGYITGYITVTVTAGIGIPGQNGSIAEAIADDQTRIILTWGTAGLDLDSYLYLPGGGRIYWNNIGDTSSAMLDRDSTSLGPETTTIYVPSAGTYTFYVNDYDNAGSTSSYALSNSGANVTVIRGDTVIGNYNVPTGVIGTTWKVFTLNGSTITPVNIVQNGDPGF
jgi:hypothetical protein